MTTPKILLIALVVGTLLPLGAWGAAPPGTSFYEGPGVVVTKFDIPTQQITVLDNGAVICEDTDDDGVPDYGRGGGCLPFGSVYPAFNAVHVNDAKHDAVFQVCVDVEADGVCTGGVDQSPLLFPPTTCGDVIFYSHDSGSGDNYNPLQIPTWVESYWAGCGAHRYKGFAGYVVILCAGVHSDKMGLNAHVHEVSAGLVSGASTSDGRQGDFCGAPTATKHYDIVW